jgi:hypothetical protein
MPRAIHAKVLLALCRGRCGRASGAVANVLFLMVYRGGAVGGEEKGQGGGRSEKRGTCAAGEQVKNAREDSAIDACV